MNRRFLPLVFIVLFSVCSRNMQDIGYKNPLKMEVETAESRENRSLADSVSEYRYVKLETGKDCLIGWINKILTGSNICTSSTGKLNLYLSTVLPVNSFQKFITRAKVPVNT